MQNSLDYCIEAQRGFMVFFNVEEGSEHMLSVVVLPIVDVYTLSGDASNLLDFVGAMQYKEVYKDSVG